MKKTRRKGLLAVLAMVLVFSLCLPLAVSADGAVGETEYVEPIAEPGYATDGVVVYSDEITVKAGCDETYSISVYATENSAPFASWQFSLLAPYFITVQEVVCPNENGVFVYSLDGNKVNLTFSSSDDACGGELVEILFTLNEDAEPGAYGAFEQTGFAQFTNTDFEELPYSFNFKMIAVQSARMKGDFNNDGEVTLQDVIEIQQAMVGLRSLGGDEGFYAADINHDNMVTILDVQYIQMYLIGKIESLEDIYSEEVAYLIAFRILDPYGNQIGEYTVSVVDPEEGDTYKAVLDLFFFNESVKNRFPTMIYDSAFTTSGANPFDDETIISHDDSICVFIAGDEFTYTDDDIQTRVWLNDSLVQVYEGSTSEEVTDAIIDSVGVYVERFVVWNGEYRVIEKNDDYVLTADQIGDLSGYDFSEMGKTVELRIEVEGQTLTLHVYVVPDLREVEMIADGVRVNEYFDSFGNSNLYYTYFAFYENGIVSTRSFSEVDNPNARCNYKEYELEIVNDCVLFGVAAEGTRFYMTIDENSSYEGYSIVGDYMPDADAETTAYSLFAEGYQMKLIVFNDCYAMVFYATDDSGRLMLEGTVKVEIDPEANTFTFMDMTYQIGEDNTLSIPLPDEDPVDVVYYLGETVVFYLYDGGTAYYTMNGAAAGEATWEYECVETEDGGMEIVALNITMTGYTQRFVRWDFDGNWYPEEEPDFDEANALELTLDGETATLYVWENDSDCYLQKTEESPLERGYYAESGEYISLRSMNDEYYLIRNAELLLAGYYQVLNQKGENAFYLYVADGYATGWLGENFGYRQRNMTYFVDSDGLWTFFEDGEEVMTCVLNPEVPNTFDLITPVISEGLDEPEEKVIVYVKKFVDGVNVETFEVSFLQGASLYDAFGYMAGETIENEDGTVTVCQGVFLDPRGTKPLSERDYAVNGFAVYVLYQTVEE